MTKDDLKGLEFERRLGMRIEKEGLRDDIDLLKQHPQQVYRIKQLNQIDEAKVKVKDEDEEKYVLIDSVRTKRFIETDEEESMRSDLKDFDDKSSTLIKSIELINLKRSVKEQVKRFQELRLEESIKSNQFRIDEILNCLERL
ncbi:expressed protein [Phakopsora pachyrhizi]|uniref:Expressed protein n=1 Tax=Phakopsora pachyrhizi TaxID=170000 RepID=A0AAV0ALL3_PHAPC|nr:expressed protein [Phakopsora pachyrhizi]